MAASCQSCGSAEVLENLEAQAGRRSSTDSDGDVCVKPVGCIGLCSAGPLVSVESAGSDQRLLYQNVTADDAEELYSSLDGQPVERLRCPTDVPFFTRQHNIVLKNSGVIDPQKIDDYIAAGGYASLVRSLTELQPEDVLREVKVSGLRGRGGGGYPAGLKWATVAMSPEPHKYVICNADEGDPGAFMDRVVLESDPHRVLEGMALAGYAVGAEHGYIYIRAEYPQAVDRLKTAIKQATRKGLLGRQICDTRFSFEIELRLGAGAFVC